MGYADSYSLAWPGAGTDSVTVVHCSDELEDPEPAHAAPFEPADASDYAAVVGADNPTSYWRWSDALLLTTTVARDVARRRTSGTSGATIPTGRPGSRRRSRRTVTVEGSGWRIPAGGGYAIANETPIVGDFYGSAEDGVGGSLQLGSGARSSHGRSARATCSTRPRARSSAGSRSRPTPALARSSGPSPEVDGVAARLLVLAA